MRMLRCRFVLLAALFVLVKTSGTKAVRPRPRILGGSDADIKNYPHQVSVEWLDMHICSGTIISKNFVITSAHCLDYKSSNDVNVRAGSSLRHDQDYGVVARIKTFHIHPRYTTMVIDDGLRYVYDVAILELEQPLPIEFELIGAIDLPEEGEVIPDGTDVAVLGWGTLSEDSQEYSEQLQKVTVKTVPMDECDTDYEATVEMDGSLCAGETGKGFCEADDGGPLIHDSKLFGTASWQIGCGEENKPGVYSNIAVKVNRDFITKITGL